ncbi:hypothetical protein [Polynucleobacter sp. Tro8-14-1]|jgi:hypothetical protein|uniref:hypothetical protein n=1 Tax=Polynucleobacter sp. Tro8-14-1 TaxID=1758383 RepID=UPI001C0D2144|nr:hypothetical protein [Polynucleobacter sp. Tro8-14-1]MBU3563879.1 hypothetical protein [Polynucleobacter sp. Tro8-14-1]
MSSLKIFVVFHQTLDQRLIFPHFTNAEIAQWFVFYGVNIEKTNKKMIGKDGVENTDLANTPGVTLEYQLDTYHPELQQQGYMETSCFLHILSNNLFPDSDLIGVTQYDMRWTEKSTGLLRKIAEGKSQDGLITKIKGAFRRAINPAFVSPQIAYAQVGGKIMDSTGQLSPMTASYAFNWPYLIESYNNFFGTHWSMNDLRNQPLTLWQTYLLPRPVFIKLTSWLKAFVDEVTPWANKAPYETHWGVLGGYTERAEALFIALQVKSGALIVHPLMLEHDENIPKNLQVSKEHYAEGAN